MATQKKQSGQRPLAQSGQQQVSLGPEAESMERGGGMKMLGETGEGKS